MFFKRLKKIVGKKEAKPAKPEWEKVVTAEGWMRLFGKKKTLKLKPAKAGKR